MTQPALACRWPHTCCPRIPLPAQPLGDRGGQGTELPDTSTTPLDAEHWPSGLLGFRRGARPFSPAAKARRRPSSARIYRATWSTAALPDRTRPPPARTSHLTHPRVPCAAHCCSSNAFAILSRCPARGPALGLASQLNAPNTPARRVSELWRRSPATSAAASAFCTCSTRWASQRRSR